MDTARERNSASYGRIILQLKGKEGLQYVGWLQMAHDIGEWDVLFTTINLKYSTFSLRRRVAISPHKAVCAPTGHLVHLLLFLPKSYCRVDKVWNKNIYFRNVTFMNNVIQLRSVVVYKYASMNIYVVSFCSLLWEVFSLLNIYGYKKQSL
jgi:hypothetical protein